MKKGNVDGQISLFEVKREDKEAAVLCNCHELLKQKIVCGHMMYRCPKCGRYTA